jgi:predicted transposase YdaD
LDELGDVESLPLGLAAMVLTTKTKKVMPGLAKGLVDRAKQEVTHPEEKGAIINMVSTIMVHQFTNLSRQEVDKMLGIRLEETRVYQDAKEEGREEGQKALLIRLLNRQIGKKLPKKLNALVEGLSFAQIERLGDALLDFKSIADLETWLDNNA